MCTSLYNGVPDNNQVRFVSVNKPVLLEVTNNLVNLGF